MFTKEMKKTHTVLIPSMLDFHFPLLKYAFLSGGFKAEILNADISASEYQEIVNTGLEFSHGDICFPANLIIGQFISTLRSGKYNAQKTALLLPQAGGGCRACNYIHLLRKALIKSGFENVPVISLNVSGVEKHPGFSIKPIMLLTAQAAIYYGDLLMYLYNKTLPYEKVSGETDRLLKAWIKMLSQKLSKNSWITPKKMCKAFYLISKSFSKIKTVKISVKKICISGELYIKFCALGNNNLERLLRKQNAEIVMGGFVNYMMYLIDSCSETDRIYGKISLSGLGAKPLVKYMSYLQNKMNDALTLFGFEKMTSYNDLKRNCSSAGSFGEVMGDGWLIAAEVKDALTKKADGAVIAVPFGCLVSHTCARGIIRNIRNTFPEKSVQAVDFDSGLSRINQQNRINMILNFCKGE